MPTRRGLMLGLLMGTLLGCGQTGHPGAGTTAAPSATARPRQSIVLSTATPGTAFTAPATVQPTPSARSVHGTEASHTAAAARRAFDAWLQALAGDDATTVLAHGLGAAAAFAAVQLATDQVVRGGGGTTVGHIGHERLTPRTVTESTVELAGEVDLQESVSGSGPHFTSVDRITGPVRVVMTGNGWKVLTFGLGGEPMAYYPEAVTKTVRGVRLTVAFVLTTADATTALVGLSGSTANQALYLQRLTLAVESGPSRAGKAYFGPALTTGLFTFGRAAGRPTRLVAQFRDRDGAAVDFDLALTG